MCVCVSQHQLVSSLFFCSNLSLYPSLLPPSPNLPVCLLAGHQSSTSIPFAHPLCDTSCVCFPPSRRFYALSIRFIISSFIQFVCEMCRPLLAAWYLNIFFPFLPVVTNSDEKLRTNFFLVKAKPINNIRLV